MTNFPGDAVKLEAEILLNRFRCNAQLIKLGDSNQNCGCDIHPCSNRVQWPEAITGQRDAKKIHRHQEPIPEQEDRGHLVDLRKEQEHAANNGAGRPKRYEQELEEIERRVAETLERHRALCVRNR